MAPHHGHAQPAATAPPRPHGRLKASGGPAGHLKRQPTASAPPPAPRRTPRTYATAWPQRGSGGQAGDDREQGDEVAGCPAGGRVGLGGAASPPPPRGPRPRRAGLLPPP